MTAQPSLTKNLKLPRNSGLPEGISLLRKLNSLAKPSTLNLGLGKPEIDMPSELKRLARKTLFESKLEYTENAGDLSIRNELARELGVSQGKQMILTHGAQEALMAALLALLNPGDEVLIPDPGFLSYAPMVKMLGGKAVPYRLRRSANAYVHDLKSITSKITSQTRAILISSPGNPTGCDFEIETLKALLLKIDRKRIVVLSDEVYGMLHFKKPYRPLALFDERVISINSFSKSHALSGWRIGYLTNENSSLLQSCLVAHQYITTCASVPSQRLLGEILKTPYFKSVPAHYRKVYESKLGVFRNASNPKLQAATAEACGGFYLFPSLPKKQSSLAFCEQWLESEDVLAIPGSAFGRQGESSIRLSLALPDAAIVRAAKLLSGYYRT